jgi:hypothetical protein
MLTTSSAYKTAISASSRQIKSRCAIAYTYPFIHAKISGVASSTEHADSDRAKVVEGLGLGDYYNAGKYRGFKNNAASDANAAYATNACYLQVNYIANEILTRMELVGDLQGEITVTNLAVNGGFEDGVLAPFTCDRTATITGGIASFTTTSQNDSLNYPLVGVDGAKYAYIAKVKTSAPSIRFANNWGGMLHTGGGAWEILSFIGTLSGSTDAGVEIIDLDASTHGLVEVDYIMIIPVSDDIGTDYFLNLKYKAMDYFSMPQVIQKYETPVDYTIKYLNSADSLLATTTVTNNYELKKINAVSTALTTIRKVRLDVTKWSRASVSAKISGFSPRTVVNYDGNQIMTIEVNEEIETEQGSILGTAIAKRCDITFNNIEGDFDGVNTISNRVLYPEIGAVLADGTVEYEPMGTYYTEEWDFSDDRLTLNVSGLDILGYMESLKYTASFPIASTAYYGEDLVSAIITNANVGYSLEIKNSASMGVKVFLNTTVPVWGNVSLRQVLSWAAEIVMGYNLTVFGCGYIQSSKYKNTIELNYRLSEAVSFSAVRTISADNYFKIKNKTMREISPNTYYIQSMDGNETVSLDTARIAVEGTVSNTLCKGNAIIQTSGYEGTIVEVTVNNLIKNQGDRLKLEWQGDTSLELCDETTATSIDGLTGYNGYMVSNQIKFDGGLRQISTFKILETEAL